MSEARVFADDFQRTFAQEGDLMRFLEDRAKHSLWIRKPTKDLRLMPVDHEKVPAGMDEELKEDTRQHTQLILRMKDEYYPVFHSSPRWGQAVRHSIKMERKPIR